MADKSRLPILQGYGIDNVLRILDPLKNSANGNLLYRHVVHTLTELERNYSKISLGYATILNNFIVSLRKHLPKGSLLNTELKIIQQRLRPPITLTEMAAIQNYLRQTIEIMSKVTSPDEDLWREAIQPLTNVLTASEPASHSDEPLSAEIDLNMHSAADINITDLKKSFYAQALQPVAVEQKSDSGTDTGFEQQQNNLVNSIVEAMQHQARFGLLLEDILNRLTKAETQDDVDKVRSHAISELQNMSSRQGQLVKTLNNTHDLANLVRESNLKLNAELNQIRILSMTDELTELPNRRAFLQRLEEEIQRATRYHYSFCIAMIDLDNFKQVNDTYGHAAGDVTLREYANQILVMLRRTDLISRYGGEEFAILFPKETLSEARLALEKVRQKASVTRIEYEGIAFNAPSFSAGLVTWDFKENAAELINRADSLLYSAKGKGGDYIETEEAQSADEMAAIAKEIANKQI
jgi:diguanylate cyclase (GGDEF)-like protein